MKLSSKTEWFELESPIGEPNINWDKKNPYFIERVVMEDGEIRWFGQGTNWVKKPNDCWRYLGVDETVKPTLFIEGGDGEGDYYEYPEGRNIFIECEEPVYEKLYKEIK